MPLAPYTRDTKPGEIYQDVDGEFWKVVGYIDQPAAILQKIGTWDAENRRYEVIGCPNADRWTHFVKKPE
jgi:hypothetical protein